MKSLLIIFGLLISIMLVGCVVSKPSFHSTIPADHVYIDPQNSWTNQCPIGPIVNGTCSSSWRSITVRVVNKKYRDVRVTVKCLHMPEKLLFGEQTAVVNKRDDATFVVWGLGKSSVGFGSVVCQITNVR